ncbi:MAG: AcrR family transcriptional regulator [Myxococcota bacterium]|jgi:AcrR family transcriptional regulator
MDVAKKESILDAAVRAFARHGFKKASIDAIAKAAGVAKGTVYLACENKADLFYQSVHRELRQWIAECGKHIDPRRPADELLSENAGAALVFLEARPLVRDLLLRLTEGSIPDWQLRFDDLRDIALGNTIQILKLGQRQGRFRAELDVDAVAEVLQDMYVAGYIFSRRPGRDATEVQTRFRTAFDVVLNGLLARTNIKGQA